MPISLKKFSQVRVGFDCTLIAYQLRHMADEITIHRFTAPQVLEFLRIMTKQMGGVAELAKRTGYDRANLDKIIKGKRKPPARLLAKLSIHEECSYVWTAKPLESVKADAK
jgi:transcriptional regulator with XRE-family HTH domain